VFLGEIGVFLLDFRGGKVGDTRGWYGGLLKIKFEEKEREKLQRCTVF